MECRSTGGAPPLGGSPALHLGTRVLSVAIGNRTTRPMNRGFVARAGFEASPSAIVGIKRSVCCCAVIADAQARSV